MYSYLSSSLMFICYVFPCCYAEFMPCSKVVLQVGNFAALEELKKCFLQIIFQDVDKGYLSKFSIPYNIVTLMLVILGDELMNYALLYSSLVDQNLVYIVSVFGFGSRSFSQFVSGTSTRFKLLIWKGQF